MIRLEAWIDGQHALKAREEQDRAGEQHEREGHLRDNQAAPQQAGAPPIYNKVDAERAWGELLALYKAALA